MFHIGGKVLLIVDDEPDILESLADFLAPRLPDVKILTAASGREALVILRGNRVSLVLSDLRMPEMGGVEFMAQARKVQPGVPGMFMSADHAAASEPLALHAAEMLCFIPKPFDLEGLLAAISDALRDGGSPSPMPGQSPGKGPPRRRRRSAHAATDMTVPGPAWGPAPASAKLPDALELPLMGERALGRLRKPRARHAFRTARHGSQRARESRRRNHGATLGKAKSYDARGHVEGSQ